MHNCKKHIWIIITPTVPLKRAVLSKSVVPKSAYQAEERAPEPRYVFISATALTIASPLSQWQTKGKPLPAVDDTPLLRL
jgi:hypothetical protein